MAQHRLDGLFYNCPEKFSREHIKQCTMKGIYFLEIADREESGDEQQDDDMTISVCALTGSRSSSTLQLATVVHGVLLEALVDSGSTHSFVDATTPDRLGLHIEELPGLIVGVANGDRVPALGVCWDISIRIDAEDFTVDLYVIRLGGYELVLGCEWLRTMGPILWDLSRLTMAFWHHDHKVHWRGISARLQPRLSTAELGNPLALLLEEFADVFVSPTGLPSPRACDHCIHLLPDTEPVAVRRTGTHSSSRTRSRRSARKC
jgi:hypothetical protein